MSADNFDDDDDRDDNCGDEDDHDDDKTLLNPREKGLSAEGEIGQSHN